MGSLLQPPTYAPLTVEGPDGAQNAINPVWLQWFLQYGAQATSGVTNAALPPVSFSNSGTFSLKAANAGATRCAAYVGSGGSSITQFAVQRTTRGLPFNIVSSVLFAIVCELDTLIVTSTATVVITLQPF